MSMVKSEVSVDLAKLEYGLERGIRHSIFSSIPTEYRLRFAPCGLVATAIAAYARRQDISVELRIGSPEIPIDIEIKEHVRHVVPFLEPESEDPRIVDASYSQFFRYVGLSWGYETYSKTKEYPKEKILDFNVSDRDVIVGWMTKHATQFQKVNRHPQSEYGTDMGRGLLADAGEVEIRSTYAKIYDLPSYELWTPSPNVSAEAEIISRSIPKSTIT